MYHIISVADRGQDFHRVRYFIDCPIDTEMDPPKCKRIEIPRALARYINDLQEDNLELRRKLISALEDD